MVGNQPVARTVILLIPFTYQLVLRYESLSVQPPSFTKLAFSCLDFEEEQSEGFTGNRTTGLMSCGFSLMRVHIQYTRYTFFNQMPYIISTKTQE